jgi:hypothetical protein
MQVGRSAGMIDREIMMSDLFHLRRRFVEDATAPNSHLAFPN